MNGLDGSTDETGYEYPGDISPITTRAELKQAIADTSFTDAKAWVAGGIGVAVAFLGGLTVALTGDNVISPLEWTIIGSTTLIAAGGLFGGVYGTPNRAKL